MPAMPIAESSAPIVVGIRHTSSATRITTLCSAFANIANGCKRHGREQEDDRQPGEQDVRARSRSGSSGAASPRRARSSGRGTSRPARAVMRTTISSDSTRVPPVTAERSPPDSRMTGADSPVIADSSTLAMPSTTSPSLGIISPALTTTSSPTSSCVLAHLLDDAVGAAARARASPNASCAACRPAPCPRPSAIASAKLAKSTVNHRNTVTRPVKTFWFVDDEPEILEEQDRRQHRADLDDEHDRVAHERARVQLDEAVDDRPPHDLGFDELGLTRHLMLLLCSDLQLLDDGAERQRREGTSARRRSRPRRARARRTAGCRSGTFRPWPGPAACARREPAMRERRDDRGRTGRTASRCASVVFM